MRIGTSASLSAVIALSIGAGGCAFWRAPEPVVVSASPTTITYRYRDDRLSDVTERARAHCQVHGRVQRLQRVTEIEARERLAVFDCV